LNRIRYQKGNKKNGGIKATGRFKAIKRGK